MTLWIILALVAAAGLAYIVLRNGLVAASERVNNGWSSVEVQLKRRHDLIPQLVKTVNAAQRHERGVIDKIVAARETAMAALAQRDVGKISAAEAALSDGLRSFLSYAEDNPEITATGNIATLQKQIEDTEDQIAAARRFYNSTVEGYNTTVRSVPWNFIASSMGMAPRAMIEFTATERVDINKTPEIEL